MESLFDRISRILATPMSRSAAIKLIVGGVSGTVLAEFGFWTAGPRTGTVPRSAQVSGNRRRFLLPRRPAMLPGRPWS